MDEQNVDQQMKVPRKKGRGCFFFLFLFLLFMIILFLLTAFGIRSIYKSWSEDFEIRIVEEDGVVIDAGSFDYTEERESLEKKIADFASNSDTETFIEFTDKEALLLIHDEIQNVLPEDLNIERMYLNPMDGEWELYLSLSWRGQNLPILRVDVVKDDFETVELFVEDIYIAGTNLEDLGLEGIKHDINNAYSETIFIINENEFASHEFINIELKEDRVVIKGELNSFDSGLDTSN